MSRRSILEFQRFRFSSTNFSNRKTCSDLLHLAQAYPVFANGYLYDLMWVNEDIPQSGQDICIPQIWWHRI